MEIENIKGNKENNINHTFFTIKALACFCVVMIHCAFPTKIGELLLIFSRWAVPFFFMLSGFFSYYENSDILNTKINHRLKKTVKLAIKSFLLYFIVNILINYFKGSFNTFLHSISNWKNILKLVLCNWTTPFIGVGHIWFLLADIYVYIIFKFIVKHNKYKLAYLFSIVSLIGIYLIEVFSLVLGYSFEGIYIRNAFLLGLPLFMLGHYISKNKNKILSIDKKKIIIVFTLLYSFAFIIETLILKGRFEFYLNNIIFNILMFLIALNYPNIKIGWEIGKNHSSNIYVIHYLVIIILNLISTQILNKIFSYIAPILVFVISLIISIIINKITNIKMESKFQLKKQ